MSPFDLRVRSLATHPGFAPTIMALLGAILIGGRSVATDESFTWGIVAQPDLDGFWGGQLFVSGNMTAYFALLRVLAWIGEGVVWLRLPSLVFGVATVIALYRLATVWFDRRTAAVAAVLAATSVPLVYYSIEMRSYSLVALTATLLWYHLERAISTDELRHWLLLGLAGGLAVSGQLVMFLVLPWVGLAVLVGAGVGLLGTAIRLIPLGLASVPTLLLILLGDGGNIEWIPELGPVAIARAGRLLLGDHAQFTHDGSGFLIAALYVVLYALAFVGFFRSRAVATLPDGLAWLWFLSLPVTMTAVSVVEPILWHRYLIGALPGGILVVATYVARLDRRTAVALVAVLAVLGVVRSFALRDHSADEYEGIAALIEEQARPDDALVVITPWTRAGLDYYWRDGAPLLGEPPFGPAYDRGLDFQGFDWVPAGSRIWLFDRSETAQAWVSIDRTDDDYDFARVEELVPDGYEFVGQFDVQRFRVKLYEPGS